MAEHARAADIMSGLWRASPAWYAVKASPKSRADYI